MTLLLGLMCGDARLTQDMEVIALVTILQLCVIQQQS